MIANDKRYIRTLKGKWKYAMGKGDVKRAEDIVKMIDVIRLQYGGK